MEETMNNNYILCAALIAAGLAQGSASAMQEKKQPFAKKQPVQLSQVLVDVVNTLHKAIKEKNYAYVQFLLNKYFNNKTRRNSACCATTNGQSAFSIAGKDKCMLAILKTINSNFQTHKKAKDQANSVFNSLAETLFQAIKDGNLLFIRFLNQTNQSFSKKHNRTINLVRAIDAYRYQKPYTTALSYRHSNIADYLKKFTNQTTIYYAKLLHPQNKFYDDEDNDDDTNSVVSFNGDTESDNNMEDESGDELTKMCKYFSQLSLTK